MAASLVVALALPLGCRALLDIHDPPVLDDAGANPLDAEPADGGKPPDAAPTFCERLDPPAQLCSDFEKGSLSAGWEDASTTGRGELGELLDETGRKLRVTTQGISSGSSSANLFLNLPIPAPTQISILANMKIVTEEFLADKASLSMLFQIVFGFEGGINVYRDALGTTAMEVTPGGETLRFPVSFGAPHTIRLEFFASPKDGADGLAVASVDNNIAAQLPVPAHFRLGGRPTVIVGLRSFAPVGPVEIILDNVALYWK